MICEKRRGKGMKSTKQLLIGLFMFLGLPSGHVLAAAEEDARFYYGKVMSGGAPVAGAQVTLYHGKPTHSLTVFADEQGRYLTPGLEWDSGYRARFRRPGWRDLRTELDDPVAGGNRVDIVMEPVDDIEEIVTQLPSNYWMQLMLEEFDDQDDLYEFKMQCTYCHQQGSPLTSRRDYSREQWQAIVRNMAERSAILTHRLRDRLPDIYVRAYEPENVRKKLAAYDSGYGPTPLPDAEARKSVVREWDLGGPTSNQHDVMVYHPDGSIWSVDGPIDTLHKISFDNNPDGERTSYKIPTGDHKPGGFYWKMEKPMEGGQKTYLAPHSLQYAPDGRIWLTLAMGNQLAGFDPKTEEWQIVDLDVGLNPHTLRFDAKGRLWYTITATNHVGMYNPETGEQEFISLPAPDWTTALILKFTRFFVSNADWLNLRERSADMDGVSMPMAYGIDVNPVDGTIWYSQLNMSHIGYIDPETFEVTPIETPFVTPRRLRVDSKGGVWVPSYSESSLHLYTPETGEWKRWQVPVEPLGTEVPYAVYIDKKTDHVWITGTQSDTLIRFVPETEAWTVYPLPTRVTYTREIDMDGYGNFWTSHSNGPAWHVEDGIPKVTMLDPDGAPDIEASGLFEPEVSPDDIVMK
jgi:streptogramin lyase